MLGHAQMSDVRNLEKLVHLVLLDHLYGTAISVASYLLYSVTTRKVTSGYFCEIPLHIEMLFCKGTITSPYTLGVQKNALFS